MRSLKFDLPLAILSAALLLLGGCRQAQNRVAKNDTAAPMIQTAQPKSEADQKGFVTDAVTQPAEGQAHARSVMRPVSLKQADQSQSVAEAMDRKIIKDAELSLEVPAPIEDERKVASIAESHGGFVVTSESRQRPSGDGSQHVMDITLVLRVPAAQFGATLDQIHALSNNITGEKRTGQDVTEEFIDLEARSKTQKALEAQFLEIMKQAHKVEEALEVQQQIAEVRGEIEKLEGRKRFLENRSSLSTITVNLNSAGAGIVVNTSGFGKSIKEAVSESIGVAGDIVLFLIRLVIVMIPVFLFVLLPLGLLARYFVRRARRFKLAREMTAAPAAPAESA